MLLLNLAATAAHVSLLDGKKLIEYGQGFPTMRFYRDHYREKEKVGFDGVVILAEGQGGSHGASGVRSSRRSASPQDD